MENTEKKLTINNITGDDTLITSAKEAFYLLHKLRINKGVSVAKICNKTRLHQTAYSRYLNDFKSQNRCAPKVDFLIRFADALDCEIRIVNKKIENDQDN
tara:strand:- start:2154 stop:2453 length:300 start_codon:yes stop_codon:yes gene_type:complete